jgi:uncharacterized repeat protein (TIGR02543 family)
VITALVLVLSATVTTIPLASANPFTISYNANADIVGAVTQKGITTGSVPTSSPQASGTTYTVLGQGTLARQGFTFAGWNTSSTGTGTTYQPGSTFAIASSFTLFAIWTVPVAARLIGNGGTIINVADTNSVANGSLCLSAGIRGITSDGTHIYFRPSTNSGYICKARPDGVLVSVHLVTNLSTVPANQLALFSAIDVFICAKIQSQLSILFGVLIYPTGPSTQFHYLRAIHYHLVAAGSMEILFSFLTVESAQ